MIFTGDDDHQHIWTTSAEEALDNLFRNGPPPHHMDVMHDLFPMLKNKIKIPPRDGASVEGYA
jgi:hypothetical protein